MTQAQEETRGVDLTDLWKVLDLIDLFERTKAPRPTQSQLAGLFAQIMQTGGQVVGHFVDAELVATCTLNVCPNLSWSGRPYAIIENVIVRPEFRKRGYGRAVLNHATEAAKEIGCYKVALMTGSKKAETLAFYESAGFAQTKTGFQIRFQA